MFELCHPKVVLALVVGGLEQVVGQNIGRQQWRLWDLASAAITADCAAAYLLHVCLQLQRSQHGMIDDQVMQINAIILHVLKWILYVRSTVVAQGLLKLVHGCCTKKHSTSHATDCALT